MILIIQNILLIIFSGIAIITDVKSKQIPNWITYSMILIGSIINIFFNISNFFLAIGISFLIYILGLILQTKGLGGGDTKLYIGINMLLPIYNNQIFILYIMLMANLLGFIYMKFTNKKNVIFAPFIFISIILILFIL